MIRKIGVLLAVMGVMVLMFAGAALAVVKDGGPGHDKLVGTAENDILRGHGGADEIIARVTPTACLGAVAATSSTLVRVGVPKMTSSTAALGATPCSPTTPPRTRSATAR